MKRTFFLFLLSLLFSLLLCVQAGAQSEAASSENAIAYVVIAVAVGLTAAGITLFFMWRSMSTVRKQKRADAYADEGSFALTECRDVFLYSRVTRIRVKTNNSKR